MVGSGTSNAAAARIRAIPTGAAVGGFWNSAGSLFRRHPSLHPRWRGLRAGGLSRAGTHVTQSRAAMPSRALSPGAAFLPVTLPKHRGGWLCVSMRQTLCPRQVGTDAGADPPLPPARDDLATAKLCQAWATPEVPNETKSMHLPGCNLPVSLWVCLCVSLFGGSQWPHCHFDIAAFGLGQVGCIC